jgi:hypothetical protein
LRTQLRDLWVKYSNQSAPSAGQPAWLAALQETSLFSPPVQATHTRARFTQKHAVRQVGSGWKSDSQLQCPAEFACYLVHYCFRYVTGGIAAEQSEHARAAQVGLQAGLAGDDVKVDVLKAFRFRE